MRINAAEMIYQHENYRSFLKQALHERLGHKNLSLRAIARRLGMAPSHLSEILSGRKNLSLDRALMLAQFLKLNSRQSDYFVLLIQLEKAKDVKVKQSLLQKLKALNKSKNFHNLNIDLFNVLVEWYHLPILTSIDVKGFKPTPRNLAKTFGISILEAQTALDRLERLELIEKDAHNQFRLVHNNSLFQTETAHKGMRQFNQQMLKKAIEYIDTRNPEKSFSGSETMSFDVDQLDEFKQACDDFLSKMAQLSEKGKNKTRVYHMNLQFFDLFVGGNKR